MAKISDALSLNGIGTSVQMSTAPTASAPLNAGVYACWAPNQNAYITVGIPASTAITTTLGYPVITNTAPVMLNVPQNGAIGCVSSSSGVLVYEKVN